MNFKTKLQKAIFFGLLSGLLTLNLVIFFNPTARATEGGGGTTCKWEREYCPNDDIREVCLEEGDGNTCTCGAVTRSCD